MIGGNYRRPHELGISEQKDDEKIMDKKSRTRYQEESERERSTIRWHNSPHARTAPPCHHSTRPSAAPPPSWTRPASCSAARRRRRRSSSQTLCSTAAACRECPAGRTRCSSRPWSGRRRAGTRTASGSSGTPSAWSGSRSRRTGPRSSCGRGRWHRLPPPPLCRARGCWTGGARGCCGLGLAV